MTRAQEQTKEELRELLKPGDTIYTITRHVSRSGMQRRISAFIATESRNGGNEILCIDWLIAKADLFKRHKTEDGLVIGGWGMDMHFHLVYELGRILYPDGFKLAKGQYGRNGDTSGFDKDGGYAFNKVAL